MSAPRFEIVRANVGYHVRFRAANSRIVFVSETYTRRESAKKAIRSIADALSFYGSYFRKDGRLRLPQGAGWVEDIEVRDVDERGPA